MPAQINPLFLSSSTSSLLKLDSEHSVNMTFSHSENNLLDAYVDSPTLSLTTRSPTLISDNNSTYCDSDIDSIELDINSPVTPSPYIKDELEYSFNVHMHEKTVPVSYSRFTSDFLTDSEFWEYLIEHYPILLAHNRERVAKKIYQGIPENYRGRVWQSMSQSKTTYLDTLYSQLLAESSPFEADILLDLPRTFPRIEMFRKKGGEGQTRLFNVLKAYSVYDPEIGYAQGFGYIVATLLLHMSESEAFCVFVRLMQSHNLREMFSSDLKNLECRVYQFRCLLAGHFPKLVHHLDTYDVRTAMYTTSWFLTLFIHVLPQSITFRLLDVMLLEGLTVTVIRMGLALMHQCLPDLLNTTDYGELMKIVTGTMFDVSSSKEEELIQSIRLFTDVNEQELHMLNKRHGLLREIFTKK